MDLIDILHNAVLRQREDEATNVFTNVKDLSEFITTREPAAGVNVTVKMVCFASESLSAENGSLVDSSAHGMFDVIQRDLIELNAINRKPFIAQITVWDGKKKAGSPRTGRIHFRAGEFKQVHSVGFLSDIPKGNVQLDDANPDRVQEILAPIAKRNVFGDGPPGRHPKSRALALHDEEEKVGESGGDEVAASAPRTRGKPSPK